MDWIHCNKCFERFQSDQSKPKGKFFLSECSHLLCERCASEADSTKKCPVCNVSAKIVPISKDLDFSAQMFLLPFEETLRKTINVHQFQTKNRMALFHHVLSKYNHYKQLCMKYFNDGKRLQKENKYMRQMLKLVSSKSSPQIFQTSTPMHPPAGSEYSFQSSLNTPNSSIQGGRNYPGTAHRMVGNKYIPSLGNGFRKPSPMQVVPGPNSSSQKLFPPSVPQVHSPYGMMPLNHLRRRPYQRS